MSVYVTAGIILVLAFVILYIIGYALSRKKLGGFVTALVPVLYVFVLWYIQNM